MGQWDIELRVTDGTTATLDFTWSQRVNGVATAYDLTGYTWQLIVYNDADTIVKTWNNSYFDTTDAATGRIIFTLPASETDLAWSTQYRYRVRYTNGTTVQDRFGGPIIYQKVSS